MTIVASPTKPISDAQLDFLTKLIAERPNWAQKADGSTCMVIKLVTRAKENGTPLPFISRADGSWAIDKLLKIAPAPKAGQPLPTQTAKEIGQAALADLPASVKGVKYAIKNTDAKSPNTYVFYEVKLWKGAKYLNRLQGAPGGWTKVFVKYADYAGIAQRIIDATPKAAAYKYSELFTRCSCCDAPLSNGVSIAQAMGPVCAKKF